METELRQLDFIEHVDKRKTPPVIDFRFSMENSADTIRGKETLRSTIVFNEQGIEEMVLRLPPVPTDIGKKLVRNGIINAFTDKSPNFVVRISGDTTSFTPHVEWPPTAQQGEILEEKEVLREIKNIYNDCNFY